MRRYSVVKVREQIQNAGHSEAEFIVLCRKEGPSDMTASEGYLRLLLRGRNKPGADYLALFAHVLRCKIDDFLTDREGN